MNIIIAGVGGQGSLLASRVLGNVAILRGNDVKVSEVHGMSQRGGSVVTYVRYSKEKVDSPIIDLGQADYIIAFEQLEAYRNIVYAKKYATIVTNEQKINPMPVITGSSKYPDYIEDKIAEKGLRVISLDALSLAKQAGNEKAVNMVLLGVFASLMDIDKEDWEKAMESTINKKFLDINTIAFNLGFSYVNE